MRRAITWLFLFSVLAIGLIEVRGYMDRHPQDLPWTAIDLDDPVGQFTAGKLAALGDDAPRCRQLLQDAGTLDRPAPDRLAGDDCGYSDGVVIRVGNARRSAFVPAGLVTACPVAAALLLWDEQVLQPAAQKHLGSEVSGLLHAGSFSCRRIYGRASGRWSEHATADAVDVVGFRLADGRTVSVLNDWQGERPAAAFLREVRDGACGTFTTVLSPDYNAAHRDHLHLDMADRGPGGWKACR